jgi:hypothetical protein
MHVQLPSQEQPYLYVYIDPILRYYMFRLDAIIRYFVSWLKSLHCTIIFACPVGCLVLKYKSLFKLYKILLELIPLVSCCYFVWCRPLCYHLLSVSVSRRCQLVWVFNCGLLLSTGFGRPIGRVSCEVQTLHSAHIQCRDEESWSYTSTQRHVLMAWYLIN